MVDGIPAPSLQNMLANSTSPYVSGQNPPGFPCIDLSNIIQLRAHDDSPVAWQNWSERTIALAKEHDRLIFLSIGYNACHCEHILFPDYAS